MDLQNGGNIFGDRMEEVMGKREISWHTNDSTRFPDIPQPFKRFYVTGSLHYVYNIHKSKV